jgi:hypothetical protein
MVVRSLKVEPMQIGQYSQGSERAFSVISKKNEWWAFVVSGRK